MDSLNCKNYCDMNATSLSVSMQVVYYNTATDSTLDINKSGYFFKLFSCRYAIKLFYFLLRIAKVIFVNSFDLINRFRQFVVNSFDFRHGLCVFRLQIFTGNI